MKRNYIIIIILLLLILIPMNVDALSCYSTTKDNPLELTGKNAITNFLCNNVNGETLSFKYKENDVSKYFEFNKKENRVNIIDNTLSFNTDELVGEVIISDGVNQLTLYIKNTGYIEPPTTTTKESNKITYTVTLDQNDDSSKSTKTCTVDSAGEICYVSLPNLDKENFTGWGTAKTCKEGNIGSIKVDKDITYYACYTSNNTEKEEPTKIYINNLKVFDSNNEEINFGTFSIKKTSYEFKVLNNVENLIIDANVDEGIKVEIIGNENLVVGENEIIIRLTDENNNKNEYKLIVNRLDEEESINNINYLKAIVLGNININFDKNKFIYNITIPSDYTKLEINAIPENEEAIVKINGNENLIDGSSININVISNDDVVTTYTLNIIKESSNNILLIAAIGVVILLIIILVTLIIIKTNKNKKNQNNKKDNNKDNIEVLNL